MNWANPEFLHFLWLIPAVIFLVIYREIRNRRVKELLGGGEMIGVIWKRNDGKSVLKQSLLVLSMSLFIIALAGPRWGRKMTMTERKGYNIVFAVDVSSSMLAEDIKPDRLEQAKESIKSSLEQLPGSRFGLVAFSGKAYKLCPLTSDVNACRLFLDLLSPDLIPSEGTNIGEAIQKSAELFHDRISGSRIIIVVSDGENTSGDPRVSALEARKDGIKVFTISAGTKEGAPVPEFDSTGKFREYKKEKDGRTHISIVNEDLLRRVARAGSGKFLEGEGVKLGLLVDFFRGLKRGEFSSEEVEHYREKFILFLLPALAFILWAFLIREGKE